jgi:hypothetical protein
MDPVTTAVIGWATNEAGTAVMQGLKSRLGKDRQQTALGALARQSIEEAVDRAVDPDMRAPVLDALTREPPDSPVLQVQDMLGLREAISAAVGPRLAEVPSQ